MTKAEAPIFNTEAVDLARFNALHPEDPRMAEVRRAHEADEAEARDQWNKFGKRPSDEVAAEKLADAEAAAAKAAADRKDTLL